MASSTFPAVGLASLVIAPTLQRCLDIIALSSLGAATQQDHQHLAVPTEINPVARPAVNPEFGGPFADRFDVGGVAIPKPADRCCDTRRGLRVGAYSGLSFLRPASN